MRLAEFWSYCFELKYVKPITFFYPSKTLTWVLIKTALNGFCKLKGWNSIAVYRSLPGLICKRRFLKVCTKVLDVVAISSPGILIPAESVLPACSNCPRLGTAVVGWALWSREHSLSSAATILKSRNHLTVVVVMGVVTPFHTRICRYWWLEPTC